MPPVPRRDYSVPQPAGYQLGTDGRRVAFPSIRRVATGVNNLVRRFFPNPNEASRGGFAAQPTLRTPPELARGARVPWPGSDQPKDHTVIKLPASPPSKEGR